MTSKTVGELFPKRWLKAADLNGRAAVVTISRAHTEMLYQRQKGREEERLVLTFVGKKKQMVCNQTQAYALAELTGSEAWVNWLGQRITLAPGRAPSGKATIVISGAPAAAGSVESDEEE